MNIHANVQVKDEARLLEEVLPEWMEYPIDKFVFLDDNSTDGTWEVIEEMCDPGRFELCFTFDASMKYSESRNRGCMLECSRDAGADIVISLDADELLTDPLIDNFDSIMKAALDARLMMFQWNVAGSMSMYRQDNAYFKNYRDFIFPMKRTGKFDYSLTEYHSPRTPPIDAPVQLLADEIGFVHLQALNVRFYALKQLWYKTYEYVNYGKSVDDINAAYDPVVNGLDFCAIPIPYGVIGWDDIDPTIFDRIAEDRKYVEQIKKHSVPELITFGKEYLV